MRFEFWIDYLCPITYLTHKNLMETLDELEIKNYELYYRSYKLEELKKENIPQEYLDIINKFNLEIKKFDTDLVHQIAHLAKRQELGKEFSTLALDAIFVKNNDLSKAENVKKVALLAGLPEDEVDRVLTSSCYSKEIQCNKTNALNRKIDLIPHLRINMKHNFNGYYTKEQLNEKIRAICGVLSKTERCGENCACATY